MEIGSGKCVWNRPDTILKARTKYARILEVSEQSELSIFIIIEDSKMDMRSDTKGNDFQSSSSDQSIITRMEGMDDANEYHSKYLAHEKYRFEWILPFAHIELCPEGSTTVIYRYRFVHIEDSFDESIKIRKPNFVEFSGFFDARWDEGFYIHNFSILALRNVGLPISEVSTVRISPLSFVLFRNIHFHHLGERFPVNIPLFVSLLARISGSQRAISPLESWRNWDHFLSSLCFAQ